jgi:fused signal recognition particle receptor
MGLFLFLIMALFSFLGKPEKSQLQQGLAKTKSSLLGQLGKLIIGKSYVDEEVLDRLEEVLVGADVGIDTTVKIIERIQKRVAREKYVGEDALHILLKEEIASLLTETSKPGSSDTFEPGVTKPYVIMVVGVNGVGKTTTIGKLAHLFKSVGYSVVLGAGDTFRAAAVDQLKLWGTRVGVPVVEHGMQADPAAVAYDTVKQAVALGADVAIVDTAGRLHTKINLMQELSKIKRVMEKVLPDAPHEVLLVLDGSTGQNAFVQAKAFTDATAVSALAITKLDGTARGGVVIGISDTFQVPVKYIGVGEGMNDLQVFDKVAFVESLFNSSN